MYPPAAEIYLFILLEKGIKKKSIVFILYTPNFYHCKFNVYMV